MYTPTVFFPVIGLLDDQIALSPAPRADYLQQEIARWYAEGYRTVVSMLTDQECQRHGLVDEQSQVLAQGMRFYRFAIRDEVAASDTQMLSFIEQLADEKVLEQKLLVHCRGGVGRSSMLIALLAARHGITTDSSFALISQARGEQAPESEVQSNWVKQLAGCWL